MRESRWNPEPKTEPVYRLRGDRPVCEACGGTGVNPQSKALPCGTCNGEGRVGIIEPEAPQAP